MKLLKMLRSSICFGKVEQAEQGWEEVRPGLSSVKPRKLYVSFQMTNVNSKFDKRRL
jgi:hypothetical protein